MNLDEQTGLDAMKQFHNYSTKFSAYGKSWDEFMFAYGNKLMIYAEGIGLAINSTGVNSGQVSNAMSELANKAQGKLPKDHQAYINAIAGKATAINWLDATAHVASDIAAKTVQGAQAVGDSVLTSLSWLTKLLPFLVLGVVAIYFLKLTGSSGDLKNIVGKITKKAKAK